MPTGEDAHGSDYFTPVFLLPQLCNSTFIIVCARTRDYAEAKDAADNAARTLTELAELLPSTSPLFSEMRQLRSIIYAAQQSLARQQQPQDLEKGLDLITTIEECLTSKPK
ncbi:hypothetical protein [Corynebacterium striatum]|uniref:hypothetical protein n=1 Tax=Corynebacterium striatum TaxID=43770 RepID=UPI000D76A23C|nr:hypothetical protein [Corynebacterium striatum]